MKKLPMKKIADWVVEFADDNGFDVEISGNKLICFLNGTSKAFDTVSQFIRTMFNDKAQQIAFHEWKLTFDRAVMVLRMGDNGTEFHAV